MTRWAWVVLLWIGAAAAEEVPEPEPAEPQVVIRVRATRGEIIPQSKGGGGWQRDFRFTAVPGASGHWIMQVLEVRGTIFDEEGETAAVHLDVVEYYRVNGKGRAIQADSHYSQFWEARGGDLTLRSVLTYGTLEPRRAGDPILAKSFILRSATDAEGRPVEMRKRRNREIIPAEKGEHVDFRRAAACLPTRYAYAVRWDTRGSRTQPSGAIEPGTWLVETPEQTGPTRATPAPQPIPVR